MALCSNTNTIRRIAWKGNWYKNKGHRISQYVYSLNIYDEKGRVIQVKTKNITGGTDISSTQYAWEGQPLLTIQVQEKLGTNPQTVVALTKMTYSPQGKLVKIEKRMQHPLVNSGSMSADWKTIAQLSYDRLGQLKRKSLGLKNLPSEFIEKLDFEYNIRNWLTGINRGFVKGDSARWFGFELAYDKTANIVSGQQYASAQFNGNINGTTWKSAGDLQVRKYDFSYDGANRLSKADFNQLTAGSFNKSANINFSVSTLHYDANGNIQQMTQWGWKLNGSSIIDSLQYTYYDHSNKLKSVLDNQNDPNTKLGDFRSSTKYMGSLGGIKTNAAVDYAYDANGNLKKDLNKDIGTASQDDIHYNHLNLPQTITLRKDDGSIKGTITYTYDAAGNKWKKEVAETGFPVKTTLYMAGTVYHNDTLQFILQEEGRVRLLPAQETIPASLAYDYFIKDHLGNVRMVLTDETSTDTYIPASMETSAAANEEILYSNLPATRVAKPAGYPTDSYTTPNDQVAKVRGDGQKIGPSKLLKVMAGDQFNVRVSSWYKLNGASPNSPYTPLTDLVTALATSIGGIPGGKNGFTELVSSNALVPGATSFVNTQNNPVNTRPKAYLNWVLLDEQFNYVSEGSGFEQVGDDNVFTVHTRNNINISKSGYLYIYVSNETPNIDVFFDNLQVSHIRGPLLEENHYYGFGGTMAGISSTRSPYTIANKIKYNGIEETRELDLNQYDAFYRTLDPQLGRFWQIDPESENLEDNSPFVSMGNNPIINADPLGDFKTWFGAFFHKIFNGGGKIGHNKYGEYYVRKVSSSVSENGVVTVVANISYGSGRKKYSSAIENIINQDKAVADFTEMGIWDANLSESQASKRALGLGLNFTIPNLFIKSGTILTNAGSVSNARKETPNIIERLTEKVIKGFKKHAVEQAITRGFKTPDILKIVREGAPVQAMGRYGPQTKYTLGGNTVVINAKGEIVTVYSTAAGTAKGLGKGNFIPFQ